MSDKPLIRTCLWEENNPDKWSIFLDDPDDASPWIVMSPLAHDDKPKWFGTHAAAVRHLVKLGWRK